MNGIHGYDTAVRDGRLDDGAADYVHIPRFFREAGLTRLNLEPNDARAGADAHATKAIAGERTVIAYLQNPDSRSPDQANVSEVPVVCRLHLRPGGWSIRWFDPRTGQWQANSGPQVIDGGYTRNFEAPFPGDAMLLLTMQQ